MSKTKVLKPYIESSLEDIEQIIFYTKGLKIEDFKKQSMIIDAVALRLIDLWTHLEKIKHEMNNLDKDLHELRRFRNRLADDYLSIDPEEIWNSLVNDLPKIKTVLVKLLKEKNK